MPFWYAPPRSKTKLPVGFSTRLNSGPNDAVRLTPLEGKRGRGKNQVHRPTRQVADLVFGGSRGGPAQRGFVTNGKTEPLKGPWAMNKQVVTSMMESPCVGTQSGSGDIGAMFKKRKSLVRKTEFCE